MKKIILIYTSRTGNTELMAFAIRDALEGSSVEIIVKESFDVDAADVLPYDGILIGTHTWEGGEVPDEILDFYEELDDLDLSGKVAAVFGSGDSFYGKTYGMALDSFMEKLRTQGATLKGERLLCDLEPDDEMLETCKAFAIDFASAL